MFKKLFFIICILFYSSMSYGKTIEIEMLNKLGKEKMVYSIKVAKIDLNDKIIWKHVSKGHNVEFLAGPNMKALPEKSELDVSHSITFDLPGVYLYQCTPHGNMGMLGLIVVGNNFNNLDKIEEMELSRVAKSVLQRLIRVAKQNE